MGKSVPLTVERLKARVVDTPEGCWLWTGALLRNGYGVISGGKRGIMLYVHRVMYELLVADIPEGLVVDHLCRNRSCCNPEHMEIVTHRENILRGTGASAQHAVQSHCVNGHEFSETNTYRYKNRRYCKTCHDERRRGVR